MKKTFTLPCLAILFCINAFGQWTTTNLSEGKTSMGSVAYGSKVYFAGGGNITEELNKVEIGVDPADLTTVFSTVDIYTCTCDGINSEVWEAQCIDFSVPQSSFSVNVVNENVAWMIGVTGDFSVTPWVAGSDLAQNEFAKTVDGGQTWTVGTYPNSGFGFPSNISAFDENIAWIAYQDFANGPKILKTTDGGVTWTDQSPDITSWATHEYLMRPALSKPKSVMTMEIRG